ncbi:MAG: lipoprotein NlpD [Porticoccus sp.]
MAGCYSSSAPVAYRSQPLAEKINYHIVSSGETLFSIAWRYETDAKKLASINSIRSVDQIYVGQKISLDGGRDLVSKNPSWVKPRKTTQPAVFSTQKPKNDKPLSWRWDWPSKGKVSRKFNSSKLFKGIDIESYPGASVAAAAPGLVIYAGSGLRGYGNLIIIKHSGTFLSAYAHNKKIFAKEGQLVEVGQKISEVGGDLAQPKRLYFEIRKNGKPVDPLRHLPKI